MQRRNVEVSLSNHVIVVTFEEHIHVMQVCNKNTTAAGFDHFLRDLA